MTKQEYADYEAAVARFMAREGIANLSSGHYKCPDCRVQFDDGGDCPECGQDQECFNEPYFSGRRCDCCGSSLAGNREFATGYNPAAKRVQEYSICEDCVYYAEYHQLDDTTMLEITAHENDHDEMGLVSLSGRGTSPAGSLQRFERVAACRLSAIGRTGERLRPVLQRAAGHRQRPGNFSLQHQGLT